MAKELGIELGGFHDFRHKLTTTLRRAGVHPVTVSGVLGHSKVGLAMSVYDRATLDDLSAPLGVFSGELLGSVRKTSSAARGRFCKFFVFKGMVSAVGIEPTTY